VTKKPRQDEQGYFDAYAAYSRTLRTWLVAYGIGAPVLFASQQCFGKVIAKPDVVCPIAFYFLVGVGVQILVAFLYKYTMEFLYWGETDSAFKETRQWQVAYWISEQIWPEILLDLVSIASFAKATYDLFIAYASC